MSSGLNANILRERALSMLEGAKWRFNRGEYDLACFEAEQAAQLYVKSLLLRVCGVAPRVHRLSELLGRLYSALREDFEDVAGELANFTSSFRRSVWFLEESYYRGRYGYVEYSKEDGRECIDTAEKLINLLRRVEEVVSRG